MKRGLKGMLAVAIACALSACLGGCASGFMMSEGESRAADDLEKLVGMAKAPDTFVLRGDVIHISADAEADDPGDYTFIEYSAENGFGTPLRGVAMFKDHRYIGDMNEEAEASAGASDAEIDELLEINETKLVYLEWNLGGRENTDHVVGEVIDGGKLASKVGVEFKRVE